MLVYPLQGLWHHLRTRVACGEVYDRIKKMKVRISCFSRDNSKSFDTAEKGDLKTFKAYMRNNFGAGKLRVRIWTND